jgi:hypothetical protein
MHLRFLIASTTTPHQIERRNKDLIKARHPYTHARLHDRQSRASCHAEQDTKLSYLVRAARKNVQLKSHSKEETCHGWNMVSPEATISRTHLLTCFWTKYELCKNTILRQVWKKKSPKIEYASWLAGHPLRATTNKFESLAPLSGRLLHGGYDTSHINFCYFFCKYKSS